MPSDILPEVSGKDNLREVYDLLFSLFGVVMVSFRGEINFMSSEET